MKLFLSSWLPLTAAFRAGGGSQGCMSLPLLLRDQRQSAPTAGSLNVIEKHRRHRNIHREAVSVA
jgi:hypothetical protein